MGIIDRRALLIVTCVGLGGLVAAPLACYAQQAGKVRRVGFLSLDTADSDAGRITRAWFPDALRQLGYIERENLIIDWRWADGKSAELPKLAAELVKAKVEVIVARTNAPIQAAMKATKDIPIVMLNGNFPVEAGLVQSLARPGGNVTGTSYLVSGEIFEKHLQILKELAPRTDRVATLRNANFAGTPPFRTTEALLNRAANRLGMTMHYFDVRQPEEVGAALAAIATSGIKAMWYAGDPIFRTRTAEIMAFLREHRLAAVGSIPTFAEGGGLAHYSPDGRVFYDRTASYVDRILKGARPSDLPVEEPTKFEFVINLKTARWLGITVPQSLLLRADKVIE
jgi:putative ABC transport system substrate-binding protein